MQKILIVTDCYEPSINGVVTTIKNIKKEAEKDGYEVLIVEPSLFYNFSSLIYPDVKISIPFGFTKIVDQFKPDYIHIATEGILGITALRYCAKNNHNFTTAFHTKWGEFMNSIIHIPVNWTNAWLRRFHKNKIVFCTSQSMIDYLTINKIGGKLVSWSRGVDTEIFGPPRTISNNNIFIRQKNLLTVNRISKEKNLDAFCQLSNFLYNLTVVGDGPYLKELKRKYPKVKFTGMLTGKELAKEYSDADCFVFPSKNDTFGVVIIEAQMMGTPVAAYPVTGPIDIIVDGVNGITNPDLNIAIKQALVLDRNRVFSYTYDNYSWASVWNTFKENMVGVEKNDGTNSGNKKGWFKRTFRFEQIS
jgi:glycosyltransferase involved in cell wall biosynthesis